MVIQKNSSPRKRFDDELALENFQQSGRVYRKKLLVMKEDLKPDEANERLQNNEAVFVQLSNGHTHKIQDSESLQRLDSLQGLSLNSNVTPEIQQALKAFDLGLEPNDGIFRPGYAFTSPKRVDAYEAFGMLASQKDETLKHTLIGAGIGAALGLATGGAAFALSNSLALAGGLAATGALAGAGTALVNYKNNHPSELEIRHGIDSGLQVHNFKETVELHNWVQEQSTHPFTREQQQQALNYLSEHGGLYHKGTKLTPEQALQRLEKNQPVSVPSSVPNKQDTMNGLRQLQEMDTVKGLCLNPVLEPEVASALRWLESGSQLSDGLYKPEGKGRLSAFEAVEHLLRDRDPIDVKLNGKNYTTKTLKNLQELNALEGDGKNTILPEPQFQALKFFESQKLLKDAYEALQTMNDGKPVSIESRGRQAQANTPADLQELNALEFTQKNDILPQLDYDLLKFWESQQATRGYEALQNIQAKTEFDVKSMGRQAPVKTFQDLQDLATFEAPQANFPNTVPAEDYDRLTFFQSTNEAHQQSPVRVGSREGRAYEGYRELRDGKPCDIRAGGVWNKVTDSTSLHELDALLGRLVNDILPGHTFDLLKELGDGQPNEGLQASGKLNSYQALQEFKKNRGIEYGFTGGDFQEPLEIPVNGLAELEDTKKRRDNQKEYDKYAYPVPEWKDKMKRQVKETPKFGQDNLQFGNNNLATGQSHERQGESHLSSGQSDLSRGNSHLSSANSQMMMAQMQPMYITTYHTVCDSNNNCHQESRQEYNWQRQAMISAAQSEISSAESEIRRAQQEIREAEDEIRKARREIDVANGQIRDANTLLGILPSFTSLVDSVNTENYLNLKAGVQAQLEQMKQLSHIAQLDRNLKHQNQLISNMETRPERPTGWQIPDPLVQF